MDVFLKDNQVATRNLTPGINVYGEELIKIGLITEKEEVKKYYYHGVSHHLGLDTHDASIRNYPLKEGAVITVEPGLYIEEEKIGIRIENDVLVTSDGCIDLASDIIRTVEDIEDFMKK
jgi:Xaa-Pro aminopeptidase